MFWSGGRTLYPLRLRNRGMTRGGLCSSRGRREVGCLDYVIGLRLLLSNLTTRSCRIGLLGGLQEFPTLPDVKTPSATAEQIAENALASVHDLLIDPVLPLVAPLTKLSRKKAAGAADGRVCKDIHVGGDTHSSLPIAPLRITHLQPAGEVLHIFSHIRKTYCVRWVVVQGGVAPPTLRAQPVLRAPTKGKGTKGASRSKPAKGKGKARRKGDGGEDDAEEADVVECVLAGRWVRLDEVRGAKYVSLLVVLTSADHDFNQYWDGRGEDLGSCTRAVGDLLMISLTQRTI